MFGFAMLDLCEVYKCASIPTEQLEFLDQIDLEKEDRSIMTHLFIAQVLGLESSGMHSVLDRDKKTKRFPSLFTLPTPSNLDDESDNDRVVSFVPNEQTPQAAPVTPAGSNPPVSDVTAAKSGGIHEHNPNEDAVGMIRSFLPPLIPHASSPPQEQRTYSILKPPGRSQSNAPFCANPHPETGVQNSLPTNPEDYKQDQSYYSHEYGDVRTGNWVASHFKDRLFDGDITQSIDHTLRDYENSACHLKLTPTQLAEYFVNILAGPARTYFYNNVQFGMTYSNIAEIMREGYNSESRQLMLQHKLENLIPAKFMDENSISSTSVGLTKLIDRLHPMTPQCPPNFRDDAHKLNYLRSAVKGLPWAKNSISNITTHKYDFNRFVTSLRESLLIEEEF